MAVVGDLDGRRRGKRKEGEELVSKHRPIRFSLSGDTERADTGQDGRALLATGTNGDRENSFPLFR